MSLPLFHERREEGESAERSIQGIFLGSELWSVSPVNRGASRDFEIRYLAGGHTEIVEVKNESRYAHSGNIVIETRQGAYGNPAGIMTSESTVVIHVLGQKAGIYRRQKMVNYLLATKTKKDRRRFAGADNGNEGFVLSLAEFTECNWFDHCELSALPYSTVLQAGS